MENIMESFIKKVFEFLLNLNNLGVNMEDYNELTKEITSLIFE